MSEDIVIRAQGLGKKYIIGHQSQEKVPTLRDAIIRSVSRFGRGAADMLKGKAIVGGDEVEDFWALRDVDFEIKRGEVVGIIGHNGAGKSTLLKVLSRITEPTEGSVQIKGRVASLLEVGTGFHPELSGRENIYLNGAILGMTRNEIARKFDEIVDFAGVERFLDTPVKRYSSGMYVRLAFAVAAHLEPEILVIDEVLAVGDAEFQKKCLGKMQDVAGQGRTVLFVSHNMGAVQALCQTGIVLRSGAVVHRGDIGDAIQCYSALHSDQASAVRDGPVFGAVGIVKAAVDVGPRIRINLSIAAKETLRCAVHIKIFDFSGAPVGLASIGCWAEGDKLQLEPGDSDVSYDFDSTQLARGTYRLAISLIDPGVEYLDRFPHELCFEFGGHIQHDESGTLSQSQGHGAVRFDLKSIKTLS
jgi:lipopolysaccharide transport system ATP-binding protein